MKYFSFFLCVVLSLFSNCTPMPDWNDWNEIPQSGFLKSQLEFPRVREAFKNKEKTLKEILLSNQIESFDIDLYLRAFKQEETLELWAKPKKEPQYRLIKSYDFCRNSGTLGPKRTEGDYQIPEGFYRISHYNPKSNFLLSLKVNYPNASDKILSDPTKPGGDIYIHGNCQTIGCIPITDDKIQEVYLFAVLAKEEGLSLPIDIFPFKMTNENLNKKIKEFSFLESFWKSLKPGYDFFENNKTLPKIEVDREGVYHHLIFEENLNAM